MMRRLNTHPKDVQKLIGERIRMLLIQQGSATKAELSSQLGISFPTISKFLSQMEADQEIFQLGLDDSSGGRRATRYEYNAEYMLGLAIFLEKRETNYSVFNCLGEVKEQGSFDKGLIDDVRYIPNHIESLMTKYPQIGAISVGVPGAVKDGRIIYFPAYEYFHNFNLSAYLEERFEVPVIVENDMNAAMLGYKHQHQIQHAASLIYLYLGQNGPGAGVMTNGEIVRGSTNFAGEITFIPDWSKRDGADVFCNADGDYCIDLKREEQLDAIARLIAIFTAVTNPEKVVFTQHELSELVLQQLARCSEAYIPNAHMPELIRSDWTRDYLLGLQRLGLACMLSGGS